MLQIERTLALTLSEEEAKVITRFYEDIRDYALEDSTFDIFAAIENRATSWNTYDGKISITYTDNAEDE